MSELSHYCSCWQLTEPTIIAQTFTSNVYKVKVNSEFAVLKILNENGKKFESKGADVLRYFNGSGTVKLLNADEGAHLLEFIDGPELKSIVDQGNDELATEVICEVLKKLYSSSEPRPSELISMERNFQSLLERAKTSDQNSIYYSGAECARKLMATSKNLKVLHGDIHHQNILKHPDRGWVAIDPQCLFGEITYDFANTFYNPQTPILFLKNSDRIVKIANKFSQAFGIPTDRILKFAFAYGCLRASWKIEDGQSPTESIEIAKTIESLINNGSGLVSSSREHEPALDSHYVNPKLAALYDLDSGWNREREFYLSLAGSSPKRILDLGCGTGLICNAMAANGHHVTGVDPSSAMLAVAKNKDHGNKIEWVQASVQKFKAEKLFDLIIMTGNASQVLLEEEDLITACQVMKVHLKPDGMIAFETRNPKLDWAIRWNYKIKLNTPEGEVIESRHFLNWSGNKMLFELCYEFPKERLVSQSQLRFWSANEINRIFSEVGLKIEKLIGDWENSEVKEESTEEMVFLIRHHSFH